MRKARMPGVMERAMRTHYWKHLKENYSVIELFTFGFDDVCQEHGWQGSFISRRNKLLKNWAEGAREESGVDTWGN